ncbi:MAG: cysteine hydrolase [Chloroflexi bacterium]|nr:cysteine hydrolase [Chloroflexota bacterium]
MTTEPTSSPGSQTTTARSVLPRSEPFLRWIEEWHAGLRPLSMQQEMADRQLRPEEIAVISEDMVRGFTYEGKLSSPRIRAIIPNTVRLLRIAHDRGVRQFILAQDTHSPDAQEFQAYPPHCIAGTPESEMIPEYRALPFAPIFVVIPKNSLSTDIMTPFGKWMGEHPELREFIVVGNCTDLCVYQTVMDLRMWANALEIERRIVVPADCVQTYDVPVELARQIGALPHDGDLLHLIFLYHMALNGIEVVREICP